MLPPLVAETISVPPAVSIASTSSISTTSARNVGVCFATTVLDSNLGLPASLGVVGVLQEYIRRVERMKIELPPSTVVILLKAPDHGQFIVVPPQFPGGWPDYTYVADRGYLGTDRFELQVNIEQTTYRIIYYLHSVQGDTAAANYCTENGRKDFWRISGNTDLVPGFGNLDAALNNYSAQYLIEGMGLSFVDLPAAVIGREVKKVGSLGIVELSPTAAGHGWYIDPTPLNNTDDFLPTADASVWQAKPGNLAFGKMDMLSVLLHEYGHVLGLEHSANPRDFMGATLLPGERRLPTPSELAQMAKLAAQMRAASAASSTTSAGGAGQSAGDAVATNAIDPSLFADFSAGKCVGKSAVQPARKSANRLVSMAPAALASPTSPADWSAPPALVVEDAAEAPASAPPTSPSAPTHSASANAAHPAATSPP